MAFCFNPSLESMPALRCDFVQLSSGVVPPYSVLYIKLILELAVEMSPTSVETHDNRVGILNSKKNILTHKVPVLYKIVVFGQVWICCQHDRHMQQQFNFVRQAIGCSLPFHCFVVVNLLRFVKGVQTASHVMVFTHCR